jgi:hypothetical protein
VPPAVFQAIYAEALAEGHRLYACEVDQKLDSKAVGSMVFSQYNDLIATPVLAGVYLVLTSSETFAPPFCKFVKKLPAEASNCIVDILLKFILGSNSKNSKIRKLKSYLSSSSAVNLSIYNAAKSKLKVMLDARNRVMFSSGMYGDKGEQLKFSIAFYRPVDDLIPMLPGLSIVTISSNSEVELHRLSQDTLRYSNFLLHSYLLHFFQAAVAGHSDSMQKLFGISESRIYLRAKRRIRGAIDG